MKVYQNHMHRVLLSVSHKEDSQKLSKDQWVKLRIRLHNQGIF